MAVVTHWTKSAAALALLAVASTAAAQQAPPLAASPPSDPVSIRTPSISAVGVSIPLPAAVPYPAVAAAGRLTSGQVARTTLPAPPVVRSLPPAKPFQAEYQRPTISPYLQLHREDLDDSLPNYFAFVLPQIHQQELLQQQQAELQQIQRRLHQTAGQVAPASPGGAAQPASYHARFLNTGGYFSGVTPHPQAIDADQ